MPSFPIPVFVACVLGFAGLRLWRQRGQANPLGLLLMLCAGQSLVMALGQHYGVGIMRWVQPLVASFIPPVAWIAYHNRVSRTDMLHALGPITSAAALLVAPQFLDVLLPGLFVIYGVLILLSIRDGADAQPDALLASGELPARIWRVIGAALVASAVSDALIAATQLAGYPELRAWIVSVFSVGTLLIIGILSLSPHLQTVVDDEPHDPPASQVADPEIRERIQAFMETQKPYLDPDLTLSRLSRKMGVPAKSLSVTINRATGENLSRFINNARIAAAQKAMLEGEPVTHAMLMSGFNTKSNFNREFLRVLGTNPTAWLREARQSGQNT
ncbi:MAG: AraC family transcriptional regulator [Rhodobacterales bacterium]|nr:MAG: AraC family transcriptional regulator [Rhodobacterales bacterium]